MTVQTVKQNCLSVGGYSAGSAHNAQVERREDVGLCNKQLNYNGRGCFLVETGQAKSARSAPGVFDPVASWTEVCWVKGCRAELWSISRGLEDSAQSANSQSMIGEAVSL